MFRLRLLELDGVGNLILGTPLLLFPGYVSEFLGLPTNGGSFYAVILGAIFFGIGIALLLERFRPNLGGLGIGGAMCINLIFGLVLAGWLLLAAFPLPTRGVLVLSFLAVALVLISLAEIVALSKSV